MSETFSVSILVQGAAIDPAVLDDAMEYLLDSIEQPRHLHAVTDDQPEDAA